MLADCICYVHNRGMEQEHPGMLNIKDYHHFFPTCEINLDVVAWKSVYDVKWTTYNKVLVKRSEIM